MSHGFTHGAVMTFESVAAHGADLPHLKHVAVLPLVEAVAADALLFDLVS